CCRHRGTRFVSTWPGHTTTSGLKRGADEGSLGGMRLSPDGLREALERALELEARESISRHRGDPSALSPAEVLARHDWIDSPEIGEARASFGEKGLFSSEEAGAFDWHVRRLRREQVLARARRSLETLRARRFRGLALGDA